MPLCKELLHGIGLEELVTCVELSRSQLENLLKHGSLRNNRALIHSITPVMAIPITDMLRDEDNELWRSRRGMAPVMKKTKLSLRCGRLLLSKRV